MIKCALPPSLTNAIVPYNLQRCIRDITLCSEARICKIHSLIAKIPFRAYITTNYDKFIETAYSHVNEVDLPRMYIYSTKDILSFYQHNRQFIVKLNGDIDDPDSIILVEQLQDKVIDPSVKDSSGLIWMISRSASLLIMGYNWEDPDFDHILNMISKGKGQSNSHWIIAQKGHFPTFKAKNILKDKEIHIIQYDDSESMSSLATFLEKLISISTPSSIKAENAKSELIRQTKPSMNSQLMVGEMRTDISFSVFPRPKEGVRVFCSYAHEDEELRDKLERHLSSLKDEGLIKIWHDRKIIGGEDWETELDNNMKSAHIILLLISSDFLNSHYCTGIELRQARERYDSGSARVIPVILREVDWRRYPFGKDQSAGECQKLSKLQAFPKDAMPVKIWDDEDAAFKDVASGIRKVIEDILQTGVNK
jgi:hypothetical protein